MSDVVSNLERWRLVEREVTLVWEYLAISSEPVAAEVIFVFGGVDRKVPRRAAELYHEGWAPRVLISGGAGLLTHRHFDELEAVVFRDEMVAAGVPVDAIVIESRASNSGQNVEFGMAALRDVGITPRRLVLVAKPFIMRRCVATFAKQFPLCEVTPSPPTGNAPEYIDRTLNAFARRLVSEVERLQAYTDAGYIAPIEVSTDVLIACDTITRLIGPADA